MPAADALTRFSSRVEDYVRYRPGYPLEMLGWLTRECGLKPDHAIADVGSGTGISAELFLKNGNSVSAIEPNDDMRAAAERLLCGYPRFRSIAAPAEATTLSDQSQDWVVAAQAFHWFNVDAFRRECARILRRGGRVALIWNDRRDDTPFLADYQALLYRYATDYAAVDHRNVEKDGRIEQFFAPATPRCATFDNVQVADFDGLRGRLLSSSYVPGPGHPNHTEMIASLKALFDRHARDGAVRIEYHTKLFVGELR